MSWIFLLAAIIKTHVLIRTVNHFFSENLLFGLLTLLHI